MRTGVFLNYIGLGANLMHLAYCHKIASIYGPITLISLAKNLDQALEDDQLIDQVIIFDKNKNNLKEYLKFKNENPGQPLPGDLLISNFDLKPLFKNQENIKIVKDAMYSSSNEPGGTSYRSRLEDKRYTFAGKTGSSQIKKFTEEQREAEVKQE